MADLHGARKIGSRKLYEFYLDENVVRGSNPHQSFEKPLIRVHINEAFVDPHLPLVVSIRALTCGRLSSRDHQLLGRERNRTLQLDSGLLRDLSNLPTNSVDILGVCAREPYSSYRYHSRRPSSPIFLAEFEGRPWYC